MQSSNAKLFIIGLVLLLLFVPMMAFGADNDYSAKIVSFNDFENVTTPMIDRLNWANLTDSGTVNTTGVIGSGREFGAGDSITGATNFKYFGSTITGATFGLWVYFASDSTQQSILGFPAGTSASHIGAIEYRGDLSPDRFRYSSNQGTNVEMDYTVTPTTATWHFVLFVLNETTGNFTMYYDGVIANQGLLIGSTLASNSLGIGTPNLLNGGRVDNVMLWANWTPTTEQVQWLYNGGASRTCTELNITSCATPASPFTNATIRAYDFYTNTTLFNISVFNNNTLVCQTTNGTCTLPYLTNTSSLYNLVINSTDNGGYFNLSRPLQNISGTMNFAMSQSINVFNATQKVTGALVANANFTTNYTTNTTHYMRVQSYPLTATAPLYNNVTISYTPVALTSSFYIVENLTNQNLTVNVTYFLNGTRVPVYTLTISNSTYGFSETHYITTPTLFVANLTAGVYYTVAVNTSDAFSNSTAYVSAGSTYTVNLTLVSTTQFNLYFFDEQTLLPVNNVNYTIIGATYAYTGSTASASNNVNFSAIATDTYEIRYVDNNMTYNPRSYFVVIPLTSASQANLSLYMLKTSNATSFVLTVTDTYNQPIAGLTASLLRRYAIGGLTTYYVVEMMRPSVALQGATPFSAVANTVPYIFRIQDSAGNVVFQGAGTSSTNLETQYLLSTNIYIKVQTETTVLQGAQNFFGLTTALTNTSTALQLSWSGSATTLSQICLQMYTNLSTLLTNSCSTSPSGIISYTYNPTVGTIYTGFIYATSSVDGKQYLVGNPFVDNRQPPSTAPAGGWGYLGIFLVVLMLMLVGIGFADRPSVSIILGGVTIFTFFTINAFGNIILLPTSANVVLGGSALMISIIIAYAMREEF